MSYISSSTLTTWVTIRLPTGRTQTWNLVDTYSYTTRCCTCLEMESWASGSTIRQRSSLWTRKRWVPWWKITQTDVFEVQCAITCLSLIIIFMVRIYVSTNRNHTLYCCLFISNVWPHIILNIRYVVFKVFLWELKRNSNFRI